MALDAGKLNARVSIQAPTATAEGAGGSTLAWAESSKRWVQIITMTGREPRVAGVIVPQHSHVVRMRHLSTLTTRNRLVWGAKVLEILSVADKDDQHEETVCECNEVAM